MTGWVILELFGHVRLVGEVSEAEAFGGKLGRIDVLLDDGSTVTQFFGAASVYRLTPTDEATARSLVAPRPALPYTCGLDASEPVDWSDPFEPEEMKEVPPYTCGHDVKLVADGGAVKVPPDTCGHDDDDSSTTPGAQVNAQTGSEYVKTSFHPRRWGRLPTTREPQDAGVDTDVAPAPEPREAR